EGSPGAAREPRVYGKPAGCSKWMRSYSRLGALVSKESARQYEEGQTDARSDECLPEVNSCKGLFQRAPRLADRVNSPAETASRPGGRIALGPCLYYFRPHSHDNRIRTTRHRRNCLDCARSLGRSAIPPETNCCPAQVRRKRPASS